MRFNEGWLKLIGSRGPFNKEGRLSYKQPRDSYRERWMRLKNNLLFGFRLNSSNQINSQDAQMVFVLDRCNIQEEPLSDVPFTFSIIFYGDDRKHYFSCTTDESCKEWIEELRMASYANLVQNILDLKFQIMEKTGKDPKPELLPGQSTAEAFMDLVPNRIQKLRASVNGPSRGVQNADTDTTVSGVTKRHKAPDITSRRAKASQLSGQFQESPVQEILDFDKNSRRRPAPEPPKQQLKSKTPEDLSGGVADLLNLGTETDLKSGSNQNTWEQVTGSQGSEGSSWFTDTPSNSNQLASLSPWLTEAQPTISTSHSSLLTETQPTMTMSQSSWLTETQPSKSTSQSWLTETQPSKSTSQSWLTETQPTKNTSQSAWLTETQPSKTTSQSSWLTETASKTSPSPWQPESTNSQSTVYPSVQADQFGLSNNWLPQTNKALNQSTAWNPMMNLTSNQSASMPSNSKNSSQFSRPAPSSGFINQTKHSVTSQPKPASTGNKDFSSLDQLSWDSLK